MSFNVWSPFERSQGFQCPDCPVWYQAGNPWDRQVSELPHDLDSPLILIEEPLLLALAVGLTGVWDISQYNPHSWLLRTRYQGRFGGGWPSRPKQALVRFAYPSVNVFVAMTRPVGLETKKAFFSCCTIPTCLMSLSYTAEVDKMKRRKSIVSLGGL